MNDVQMNDRRRIRVGGVTGQIIAPDLEFSSYWHISFHCGLALGNDWQLVRGDRMDHLKQLNIPWRKRHIVPEHYHIRDRRVAFDLVRGHRREVNELPSREIVRHDQGAGNPVGGSKNMTLLNVVGGHQIVRFGDLAPKDEQVIPGNIRSVRVGVVPPQGIGHA